MARLFLGLDLSTQSLSAIVIDLHHHKVIYEHSINFDKALPEFKTKNGVLSNRDPLIKHAPPLLFASALDVLFERMKKDKVPLREILAISGSGQQHGTVYLNEKAEDALSDLNPKKDLRENLRNIFSRKTSPIWMDSSTAKECKEITKKIGGSKAVTTLTGSLTFERFSGPQIRKFYKTDPKGYQETPHIALISSFMASILSGRIAPMDYGDGAGMNLMDIRKKTWSKKALDATASELQSKLPPLKPAGSAIGPIHSYFVKKYGFSPKTLITVWTGDNPASAVGLGLTKPGTIAISLGTSDTLFGAMKKCETDPRGEGHLFGSPVGGYMSLICFKNGSLAREKIRNLYKIASWKEFGRKVKASPVGNDGGIMLPWFDPEIVPRVSRPKVYRFDLNEKDGSANCRAVLEAQMLSMKLHSKWMKAKPKMILATGGASENPELLQIMANVMNCPVARIEISKSASLGAAIIAAYGYLSKNGQKTSWETLAKGFAKPIPGSKILPDPHTTKIYSALLVKYAKCEKKALREMS